MEKYLFDDLKGNYQSEWADGLSFLRELQQQPPPFRQPLKTKSVGDLSNISVPPSYH